MATKKAILEAYMLLSSNAQLIDKDKDKNALKVLLKSWEFVFRDIDDRALGAGVVRFLTEVTEVNRSMVISAKLRELCLPKAIPFNENIVPQVISKMFTAWYDEKQWKKLKEEVDPSLWQIIIDYPFTAIRESTTEQLPTIYAQIRNDYRAKHQQREAEEHNRQLEMLKQTQNLLTEQT